MGSSSNQDLECSELEKRPARVVAGDDLSLNSIYDKYHVRLRRLVELRLDHRLRARIDASDIIQDAFITVAERIESYVCKPDFPIFLWLRGIVVERLIETHRRHLGARMRDARRDVLLYCGAMPSASSAALA